MFYINITLSNLLASMKTSLNKNDNYKLSAIDTPLIVGGFGARDMSVIYYVHHTPQVQRTH